MGGGAADLTVEAAVVALGVCVVGRAVSCNVAVAMRGWWAGARGGRGSRIDEEQGQLGGRARGEGVTDIRRAGSAGWARAGGGGHG